MFFIKKSLINFSKKDIYFIKKIFNFKFFKYRNFNIEILIIFLSLKKKLFWISLLRFYKLRLIDNKFVFNIIYIILIKLALKDYIKEL